MLRAVDVDALQAHHAVLRELLDRERAWREDRVVGRAVADEYEHVYAAALLLFATGDPADAPRLHDPTSRTTDVDLAIGSGAHAAFGAGRRGTLAWLTAPGHHGSTTGWSTGWPRRRSDDRGEGRVATAGLLAPRRPVAVRPPPTTRLNPPRAS